MKIWLEVDRWKLRKWVLRFAECATCFIFMFPIILTYDRSSSIIPQPYVSNISQNQQKIEVKFFLKPQKKLIPHNKKIFFTENFYFINKNDKKVFSFFCFVNEFSFLFFAAFQRNNPLKICKMQTYNIHIQSSESCFLFLEKYIKIRY